MASVKGYLKFHIGRQTMLSYNYRYGSIAPHALSLLLIGPTMLWPTIILLLIYNFYFRGHSAWGVKFTTHFSQRQSLRMSLNSEMYHLCCVSINR